MTVVLLLERDAGLVHSTGWALALARSRSEPLVIAATSIGMTQPDPGPLEPDAVAEKGGPLLAAAARVVADESQEGVAFHRLAEGTGREQLLRRLDDVRGELLCIPDLHATKHADDPELLLAEEAPCATLILRPGTGERTEHARILVVLRHEPQDRLVVRTAIALARAEDASVVLLDVPSPASDEEPRRVEDVIESLVGDADRARIELRTVEGDDLHDSIEKAAAAVDLVLLGMGRVGGHDRKKERLSTWLLERDMPAAVGVMRPPVPRSTRFGRAVTDVVRRPVPKMERDRRILLDRELRESSQWDFDFIALIGLSTTIATFGLIQDSAAVVIGAMLVAPLMTPLVALGLSLVQGNLPLLRTSLRTLSLGFVLALAIALVIGFGTPHLLVNDEIAARTKPALLDMLIAGLSGVAAAYARTRPNLLSALPGVAIAAALVPPIASAGLAFAAGSPWAALSAVVLFVVNIVAIVLGSALALWLTQASVRRTRGTLVRSFGSFVVAAILLYGIFPQLQERRIHSSSALDGDMRELVEKVGAAGAAPPLRLLSVDRSRTDDGTLIEVHVGCESWPPVTLAKDLAKIAGDHVEGPCRVRVIPMLEEEAR